MSAIGTCWAFGSWADDVWLTGSWAEGGTAVIIGGDLVTTANAYFRRSVTGEDAGFARTVSTKTAAFRRSVTTEDAER